MTIATGLRINALVSVGTVALIGLVAVLAFQVQRNSRERGAIASQIMADVSELKSLSIDLLRHPEERPKQEWMQMHDHLAKSLAEGSRRAPHAAMEEMAQILKDMRTLFLELEASYGRDRAGAGAAATASRAAEGVQLRREQLVDMILVRADQISFNEARMVAANHSELERTTRNITLFTTMLAVVLVALVVAATAVLRRRIAAPLHQLQSGTEIVGAGNLDFRLNMTDRDEIGQVARSFDDMTERLQSSIASLRTSEERWATTLQSIGDGVISTDCAGKIVFMNDVAQKLTGWEIAEAQGKNLSAVFNIVNELSGAKTEDPVAKVMRLGKAVGLGSHTMLIQRAGAEIPIQDSAAPIRQRGGAIEGVVLVFHDVSEPRKLQEALRNSDRLATTGRLAASIAHEIHNPLDTVGNLLYLVERSTNEGETRQRVAMAADELGRVAQMTQQMLTFQRESARPIPVQIKDIFDNVLALYERKIVSAGIRIRKELDCAGAVLAQPGELRQVIANLLGNAIAAVGQDHGRIRLRVRASRDWHTGRRGVRVVVADNGCGIPADIRDKIFDPFFTTKSESGTGLGLWITNGIVSSYDGTLRLRSSTRASQSGTCFSMFFPATYS